MARPALSFEIRNIIHKANKSGAAEVKQWVETSKDNKGRKISLEAIPVKSVSEGMERHFLVIFSEENLSSKDTALVSASKDKRVKQLEEELINLREDMRSMIESLEIANEELQSVNEEIVSSNEELQSINEEMETSKEELESSNEELITINQELQMRNEQLAEVQEYSEAVFTTIRESLLILDKNLRIKNANLCFYKRFELTEEETEGKSLYDLGEKEWNIPQLKQLLEEIIPRNSQIVDYEVSHNFKNLGKKVLLINARRLVRKLHSEHLILLAIEDITQFRQSEQMIKEREEWFRNTADNAPMMIWVCDTSKKNQFVNKAWLEYRKMKLEDAIGKSWIEPHMHPDDIDHITEIFDDSFENKKEFKVQYRLRRSGKYHPVLSQGKPNFSHDGGFLGFIGSCVELPENEK